MGNEPLDRTGIGRVLIRSTNWLGDAVMTTPAIAAVRRSFPDARITLLANPLVSGMFAFHDCIDDVLIYDRKGKHRGIAGRIRMAAELRARRFDLAILLPNSLDAALVPWLARIPRRLGKDSDGRGMLLTHRFPSALLPKGVHQVNNYLAILHYFGIEGSDTTLRLRTSDAEDGAVAQLLQGHGIAGSDFVLGINPGAAYGSAKRWYPDRFAQVAARLGTEWDARIVITGGSVEAGIAADIESLLGGRCCNLAGKTSVRELMSVIKRCNFFVTNDSGPMHLAAAFKVPLVAVFGSTDHRTTYPYSDSAVVIREETDCAPCLKRECPTDHRCMTGVTADAVINAALDLRSRYSSR